MKRIEGEGGIQVPESVLKRDTQRKQKILASQIDNDDNRRFDYFCDTFNKKRQEIEEALEEVKNVAQVDPKLVAQSFADIADKITLLNKFVFTSSCYLRAYDIRSSKEVIQSLEESARRLQNTLIPKKKFGFKNRKALAPSNIDKNLSAIDSSKCEVDAQLIHDHDDVDFCGFRHVEGIHCLRLGAQESDGKDIKIHDVHNCTVIICGEPNTLRITSISDTLIVCTQGRVKTSVMIEEANKSCIAVSSQQLRIHNSCNTHLYLDVTTSPIIEDSSSLRFAPYPPALAASPTNSTAWATVEDFDWLSPSKPSPNWSILSSSERITDWPQ